MEVIENSEHIENNSNTATNKTCLGVNESLLLEHEQEAFMFHSSFDSTRPVSINDSWLQISLNHFHPTTREEILGLLTMYFTIISDNSKW